jgi:hypothetical protein
VAACAPLGFDVACAIGEGRKGGGVLVVVIIVVGANIGVLLLSGEAESLNVSTGEANSNNRLGGVDGLAEELGREGELAEVLVQRHLCDWGSAGRGTEDWTLVIVGGCVGEVVVGLGLGERIWRSFWRQNGVSPLLCGRGWELEELFFSWR